MGKISLINAKITSIFQETPDIKIFTLEHNKVDYKFKPGQWIDLHLDPGLIPSDRTVGGYTIISSPNLTNKIELAIRVSEHHPVTKFLHTPEALNTNVQITEGQGVFYLKQEHKSLKPILIAGGIGITPLLSMSREMINDNVHFKLLYSVSFSKDFIFKNLLKEFSVFTVTKEKTIDIGLEKGRIDQLFLEKNLEANEINNSPFYVCGPREMIDSVKSHLLFLGVKSTSIYHEKWW